MGHRFTGRDQEFQGPPAEIPSPITAPDGHDEPPGEWARYIHILDFISARHNSYIKTPFLCWLRGQRMVREPTLKRELNYTAGYFFTQLNNRTANIEAAYMQTVGEIQARPCNHCLSGFGPFTTCVKVPGWHEIQCCAGCHWWNQDHRCRNDTDPPTAIAPAPIPRRGTGYYDQDHSHDDRLRRSRSRSNSHRRRRYESGSHRRSYSRSDSRRRHHHESASSYRSYSPHDSHRRHHHDSDSRHHSRSSPGHRRNGRHLEDTYTSLNHDDSPEVPMTTTGLIDIRPAAHGLLRSPEFLAQLKKLSDAVQALERQLSRYRS